jgi:hypothetical protein
MIPTTDILYLAHGRPEFSSVSFLNLLRNTNWSPVSGFYIYTDGQTWSAPGIIDLANSFRLPKFYVDPQHYGGPVAVLRHCLTLPGAEYVCKIDNDTMVPPRWLESSLDVLSRYSLDLLGLEAWAPDPMVFPPHCPTIRTGSNHIRPTPHIGGIGFFHCETFFMKEPIRSHGPQGRYGLTEWQWKHPESRKAFLDPALPVFLLDHLPMEPWKTLNARYDQEGQQRRVWGAYPEECKGLWEWWEGANV